MFTPQRKHVSEHWQQQVDNPRWLEANDVKSDRQLKQSQTHANEGISHANEKRSNQANASFSPPVAMVEERLYWYAVVFYYPILTKFERNSKLYEQDNRSSLWVLKRIVSTVIGDVLPRIDRKHEIGIANLLEIKIGQKNRMKSIIHLRFLHLH